MYQLTIAILLATTTFVARAQTNLLTHPAYRYIPGNLYHRSSSSNEPSAEEVEELRQKRRPIVEQVVRAVRSDDCGKQIGQAELKHYGRGVYSWSEYTFSIRFDDDGGFEYSYNYGANSEVKIHFKEGVVVDYEVPWAQGMSDHANELSSDNSMRTSLSSISRRDLRQLKRQLAARPGGVNVRDWEVIQCVEEKIKAISDSKLVQE